MLIMFPRKSRRSHSVSSASASPAATNISASKIRSGVGMRSAASECGRSGLYRIRFAPRRGAPTRAMSSSRTGGEILVANLVAQGVTHAFAVPGESYLPVLDALYDARDRIEL